MELAASIQDDSFYYLIPAFLFKSKGFFTFDGVTPTYGFQPAYECLLAIFAFCFDDLRSFIRGALLLDVAMHAATSMGIAALLARQTGNPSSKWLAVGAGVFYLVIGNVVSSMTSGKENALAALLLVILFAAIPRASAIKASPIRAFLFGSLVSALVLCRLLPTTLAICAICSAVALFRSRAYLAQALGTVAPLLVWSFLALAMFGDVVPMSMRVKGLVSGSSDVAQLAAMSAKYAFHALSFAVGHLSRFHLPQSDAYQSSVEIVPAPIQIVSILAVIALGAVQLLRRRDLRDICREGLGGPVFLCTAMALACYPLQGALIARRRPDELFYFSWYLYDLPALLVLATALAAMELRAAQGPRWAIARKVATVASGLAMAPTLLTGCRYLLTMVPYPSSARTAQDWQHAMLRNGEWLRDHVKPRSGERIACSSCGALGVIFPEQLYNIDGLANDETGRLWLEKRHDLSSLLRARNVHYYIDVEGDDCWADADDGTWRVLHRDPFSGGTYLVLGAPDRAEGL